MTIEDFTHAPPRCQSFAFSRPLNLRNVGVTRVLGLAAPKFVRSNSPENTLCVYVCYFIARLIAIQRAKTRPPRKFLTSSRLRKYPQARRCS